MKTHTVGIIMNGVTGRMGTNQHLLRSIDAIIKQQLEKFIREIIEDRFVRRSPKQKPP